MRKGADCLSKWVGEAERQLRYVRPPRTPPTPPPFPNNPTTHHPPILPNTHAPTRLLFEQARRCQPSIIFFDEIDGLAPVRSSKQDQIHASIVSTLLALMDGLDDRGQVIVIGARGFPAGWTPIPIHMPASPPTTTEPITTTNPRRRHQPARRRGPRPPPARPLRPRARLHAPRRGRAPADFGHPHAQVEPAAGAGVQERAGGAHGQSQSQSCVCVGLGLYRRMYAVSFPSLI